MKCRKCGNTESFNLYTTTLYELNYNTDKVLETVHKDSESYDNESENIFCNNCGDADIEYDYEKEINEFFEKS